ncbi:transglycosylase domain-containing protein [Georgenia alba]|uniref:Transglycosylase domain-containing protein n=1 Tax=Georgenia alba TaxID=2233858 RepID=A0ABW2Q907_9MICO
MRWLPSWRFVLGAFLACIAAGAAVFAVAYAAIDVPEPDDFALAESTTVYYADGETEMGSFSEVDRQVVQYDSLPEHVSEAIVSSEDRTFYENNGIDIRGIVRALWNNVRGLPTQGGSTLTQQYVERYYVGETTTSYLGKFRETILALKIDQSQTKEEILGNYVNTIYFGRGAYGIEVAAQEFFGKPASELTLSESALLAGIIPSPSNWDPAVDREAAEHRWNRVLDLMLADGRITEQERQEAEFPETVEPNRENIYGGPNGYLLQMVRSELVNDAGMTEEEIDTRGLDIVTTIDQRSQQAAVDAVDNLPEDRPDNNRVALVSIDPRNGGVVAMYGGPDFVEQSQNDATQSRAQAGSTFKPFALIAALENGMTLDDVYPSYSPMEIEGYDFAVENFDSPIDRGYIDLTEATVNSVNTVYAQMNVDVGPENTMDAAVRAGLPEDTAGLIASPSNVLGPSSPRPVDLATAYATIASQGVRHDTHIVAEARDAEENTVYTANTEGERVFDQDVMADTTYAMSQVVERGTGITASEIGRPAAGKTGSSNAYRSAWFSGFVPQLSTTVSMFQVGDDGSEEVLSGFGGVSTVAGSTFPTQVWRDYMAVATEGMEIQDLPEPTEPLWTPPPVPEEPIEPTEEPTEELTSEEPTTEEPTTEEPTTEEPTEEPTTEEPTEEEPTEEEPTEEEPTETPTDDGTGENQGDRGNRRGGLGGILDGDG